MKPLILIGCITADVKGYCQERFLEQLEQLTYPKERLQILFVDNSVTDANSKKIRKAGYACMWVKRKKKKVRDIMAQCHDILRQSALNRGCDFLFHFETDLFLKPEDYNILDMLLLHKKQVISGIYEMGDGTERQLLALLPDTSADHIMPYPIQKLDVDFVNGELQSGFTFGIGCCLIHRSVLEKVVFRVEPNQPSHPDMYFARDIFDMGITFYADTSIFLRHENRDWGVYGLDYE